MWQRFFFFILVMWRVVRFFFVLSRVVVLSTRARRRGGDGWCCFGLARSTGWGKTSAVVVVCTRTQVGGRQKKTRARYYFPRVTPDPVQID